MPGHRHGAHYSPLIVQSSCPGSAVVRCTLSEEFSSSSCDPLTYNITGEGGGGGVRRQRRADGPQPGGGGRVGGAHHALHLRDALPQGGGLEAAVGHGSHNCVQVVAIVKIPPADLGRAWRHPS